MNYYETLEELAENGFENFINEGTEFLGRFCFDEFGNYVM